MNLNIKEDYRSADEGEEEFFDQVNTELEDESNAVSAAAAASEQSGSNDSYNSASDGEDPTDAEPSSLTPAALNKEESLQNHPHLLYSLGEQRPEFLNAPLVHEAFERVAAQHPDNQCLHFNDQWLTYAETSFKASQLAKHLQTAGGVVPGAVVAVMLERSFELVISILAVLKAGGCYLPCDPAYPDDRLAMYLEDAEAMVVLVDAKHAQRAQELVGGLRGRCAGAKIINPVDVMTTDSSIDSSSLDTNSASAVVVGPEDPAYIIFTSGSTGRPKGVVIPHRSLRDHVLGTAEYYNIRPGDASLLTITINFDPHLTQIVPCLVVGARLVISRADGHTDTEYLSGLIAREKVTHASTTPSLALTQFRSPKVAECTSLRCVLIGGEAMQREVINLFAAKVRGREEQPFIFVYHCYLIT
jgi:rhizoxin synthesis polyketide synthase/nonribosomal peptide synthetase RhiB